MSWKVLVTAPAFASTGARATQLLRDGGCDIAVPSEFGPFPADEILKRISGHDAILASVDVYSAAVFAAPPAARLKIISRWGVGYDAIDLAAATRNGVVVTYTPGLLDEAVADYAFALLLALARRVPEGQVMLRSGEWRQSWGGDLPGKTLGLVGCGRIGLAVARRATGFNLRVIAHDPFPGPEAEKFGINFVSLDALLAESDFVSLHAKLTLQNRGLIGETQLRKMKPGALLINTARGALVSEPALARALRESWIAGAALDVFETEPLPADSPLRDAPNLLLSPHQSSCSRETGERVSLVAAQAILDLLNGRRPEHVLNPEVFAAPTLRAPLCA